MKNHGKNSETILLNNTPFRYFLLQIIREFPSVFTKHLKAKGPRFSRDPKVLYAMIFRLVRPKILLVIEDLFFDILSLQQSQDWVLNVCTDWKIIRIFNC
jgi:hypothetical protein